ncbi:alpha/beta hydrolase [Nocardia sp. NPDC051981]|uniref:alpha/beta fold hydrolase n=1 Tax=Nocardia sp. NPDC051981 TaxID=3155417 RepID=UPI00342DFCD0
MDGGRVRIVDVPGARLHTECVGEGPALVLIAGGGGDAGIFADAVAMLGRDRTVMTFDRRGNSRSPFTGAGGAIDVTTQASDVVAILDAYGVERAEVFGSSGGAIIVLELLTRYPDRVHAAVVHEPPLVQLLEPDDPARQEIERIGELAVRHPMRAFAAFGVMTAPQLPRLFRSSIGQVVLAAGARAGLAAGSVVRRVTGRAPSVMTRMLGNIDLLLRRELPCFCFDYRPDLDAVRAAAVPWRLAVGRDSVGRPYYAATEKLSREVGAICSVFPGGHTGYQTHATEFTARLVEVFGELDS